MNFRCIFCYYVAITAVALCMKMCINWIFGFLPLKSIFIYKLTKRSRELRFFVFTSAWYKRNHFHKAPQKIILRWYLYQIPKTQYYYHSYYYYLIIFFDSSQLNFMGFYHDIQYKTSINFNRSIKFIQIDILTHLWISIVFFQNPRDSIKYKFQFFSPMRSQSYSQLCWFVCTRWAAKDVKKRKNFQKIL